MARKQPLGVSVVSLVHDLAGQASYVTLVWEGDATKRITLPVAYGLALDAVHGAAEQALREFCAETALLPVRGTP